MAAPTLKLMKEVEGGDFDVIFIPKVYSTNFMPFFFENFCQMLGLGGQQVPQSPSCGAATA